MLAISHIYSGDVLAGEAYLQETLTLARQIGDLRSELIVQICSATGMFMQGRVLECRDRAQRSIDLARQLSARRFQAEAQGLLASTLIVEGRNEEALQIALDALEMTRETSMSYCGASLLSIAARATADSEQCSAMLAEGEAILAQGSVSHSYLEFYGNAIEVMVKRQSSNEARRYASALECYSRSEPSPWTTLLIRRARLLAAMIDNHIDIAELNAVRNECTRLHTHALLPTIDAALSRVQP